MPIVTTAIYPLQLNGSETSGHQNRMNDVPPPIGCNSVSCLAPRHPGRYQ